MRIDNNKEALAMMKRALGSLENKFREAYNKGYYDGYQDGARYAINKTTEMVEKMLAETSTNSEKVQLTDEPNSSEKPNNCETCKHDSKEWYENPCGWCCGAHSGYEPKDEAQTDCSWK